MSDPFFPDTTVADPEIDASVRPKLLPPYNLILLNDDHHSVEFVVMVLCRALGYGVDRSQILMLEAHQSGRAVVWTGSKEVAELKLEQMQTFHETRGERKLGPLSCHLEPAPGA